ncbi:MAG: hypothetical protein M1828_005019 [Chrysothrix sp. TS-e1954]|nr:MAG: hypothetical protein M1828_005019 [Chrysothrix sp. TS-e1954]
MCASRFDTREALRDVRPFQTFLDVLSRIESENQVMSEVLPLIAGHNVFQSRSNHGFKFLDDIIDAPIVRPRPDLYDGISSSSMADVFGVYLRNIIQYAVYSIGEPELCLPNFFLEAKGPTGVPAVVTRQACYDGAFGSRAAEVAKWFADPTASITCEAHVIMSTLACNRGECTLTLYASHVSSFDDSGKPANYCATKLKRYDLADSAASFAEGVNAFRNAREWAQRRREELVRGVNSASLGPVYLRWPKWLRVSESEARHARTTAILGYLSSEDESEEDSPFRAGSREDDDLSIAVEERDIDMMRSP